MTPFLRSALFVTALTLGTAAFAQQAPVLQSDGTTAPAPHHQKSAQHDLKHLTKQLNLTPDQSAKLQPILADRDTQLNTLMADTTLDPKSKHKQSHHINHAAEAQMNLILTPAQQQQLADMKAAHHQKAAQTAPPPAAS